MRASSKNIDAAMELYLQPIKLLYSKHIELSLTIRNI